MTNARISKEFFMRDAHEIASDFLKMQLVRQFDDGEIIILDISEIEIYSGEDDLACHAAKGRTQRTQIMYNSGGFVYVYLIYGMYWLLNIVTGQENYPQAILIRATKQVDGPGRIGKALKLDKTFYGEDLTTSQRLWLKWSNNKKDIQYSSNPRIGIDYAGQYWANLPWRLKIID